MIVALIVALSCASVSFRFGLGKRGPREKSNGLSGNSVWLRLTSADG